MKIRFLETTPSENPDFPFRPGQIIDVPALTDTIRAWLAPKNNGYRQAEVVPDSPLHAATIATPERAVQARAKARTA